MTLRDFNSIERSKLPKHHIDIGFINHRRIFSTFGFDFHKKYNSIRLKETDHLSNLFNDHLLVHIILELFRQRGIKTLAETLNRPKVGDLFCSTEEFLPCPDIYTCERVSSTLKLPFETPFNVQLNYSTQYIVSSTGKMVLSEGGYKETIIAGIHSISENEIVAHPLVIGAPSFEDVLGENEKLGLDLTWYGQEWYELYPEDIDEFSKILDEPTPHIDEWQEVMKRLPEEKIKEAICILLKDIPQKDWGGEGNDHFASTMHLSGERVTGAFLLKGPARFEEMVPKHLGKNADQIYRLAQSPARLLIVQHCHLIGEAVRATLRAFAVNPASPRQYCFIDGRDTYRLMKAYDLLP